ncbi:MAG: ADOP family duplicated permease [Terriglobia bacterium]
MSLWDWLFRRRQSEKDLDEEVQAHLRMAAQEHMEQGETAEQARTSAHREFGNVTLVKEVTRDMWGFRWLETLLQDLRYSLRQLRRNATYTAIAVLTLALGIGANTAMFSIVNSVLLRPLPFRDSGRLVVVGSPYANRFVPAPRPHFEWADWANETKTLADFSIYENGMINLAGEGEPDRVAAAEVSEHFFSLLGVNPIRGRSFLAAEESAEHPFVAIISYKLWQSRYGSDPGVIGRTVHLNGKPFTIVGILPSGFEFLGQPQIWVTYPHNLDDGMFGGNTFGGTQFARLRHGATLDQVRAELGVIAEREMPAGARAGNPASVTSLREFVVGDVRPALLMLLGAVAFVLLIACANVANLSLARGSGRFREVALRAALGASRARLVRQLLTESVLLALMGGALGLLTGVWAVQVAKKLIPAQDILTRGIKVDGWVLAFTFVVAVLTGIISGLAPALQSSKLELTEALKERAGSPTAPTLGPHYRLRGLLGVSETAAALVLLIGAGLLIRSFGKLLDVDPGFRTRDLLAARVSLLGPSYSAPGARITFFQDVLSRVKALPGVRAGAFVNALPLGRATSIRVGLDIEGGPKFQPETGPSAGYLVVSPGYFQTMGIPLLRGRNFTERDTAGSTIVAIISQSLARRAWPEQNPLGKHFTTAGNPRLPFEVVGVVDDVRAFGLAEQPWPTAYLPILQAPQDAAFLVVHTAQNPSVISAALHGVIRSVDKDEPISSVSTMEQLVSQSVAAPRFRTLLLGIFGGLAFLLAVVGIYGIISYSVSQRTHEFGVRMALGAERRDVLWLVVGQGTRQTLIGVAVGLLAALGLTRLLASYLYSVRTTDPVTFLVVSAVMFAVALLASYIPAHRATKVDPMVALRYE